MISYSLKGALLSGLVFPGLGQIFLKHHKRGVALILAVSVCMLVIVIKAVQQARIILDEIMMKGGAVDISTVRDASTEALRNSDNPALKLSLLFILLFWIIGIIDAFITGRKKDIKEQSTGKTNIN